MQTRVAATVFVSANSTCFDARAQLGRGELLLRIALSKTGSCGLLQAIFARDLSAPKRAMPSATDDALVFLRVWAPVKLVAWTLLALGITFHAVYRRRVRSRGWQLNRAIVGLSWLFTGAACAEMAAVFDAKDVPVAALSVFIAFSTVADAFFLCLLMVREVVRMKHHCIALVLTPLGRLSRRVPHNVRRPSAAAIASRAPAWGPGAWSSSPHRWCTSSQM